MYVERVRNTALHVQFLVALLNVSQLVKLFGWLCIHNGLICTGNNVCVTYQARQYSVLVHCVKLIASCIGYDGLWYPDFETL